MAGRPARLTPEREQRLLDSIRAGNTTRVAGETAGLGKTTVWRYLTRGEAAHNLLVTHLEALSPARRAVLDRWDDQKLAAYHERRIPESERALWNLWNGVTRARADAEERAVSLVREAGLGYQAEETVTERKQVLNRDGEVVTLTSSRTISRFVRDWRAEAWWLERTRREDYGRQALEVTGVGGSPVEVRDVEAERARALELVDEVEAQREKRAAVGQG